MRGRPDDARLGERRDASAQTVELAAIRIGTAEGGQEEPITLGAGPRQIALVEDEATAGAAAHVDRRDPLLCHGLASSVSEASAVGSDRGWARERCGVAPSALRLVRASTPPASRISFSRGVRMQET